MGNGQPALRVLFARDSGLSEPEIGLEHAFVLLIWQNSHQSHGAHLQKQLQIRESASTAFDLQLLLVKSKILNV
jgi:hypothetical protein